VVPREPRTLDEELIAAQEAAVRSTLTDEDRLERITAELRVGFEALAGVGAAASFFGSARSQEDDPDYALARETARLVGESGLAVITGGGPGLMEASNRGAKDAGALSIGLNIELPFEQGGNGYCDIALDSVDPIEIGERGDDRRLLRADDLLVEGPRHARLGGVHAFRD